VAVHYRRLFQRRRPLTRTLAGEDTVHPGFIGPNGPPLLGSTIHMYNEIYLRFDS
jgi:hypothetical protein